MQKFSFKNQRGSTEIVSLLAIQGLLFLFFIYAIETIHLHRTVEKQMKDLLCHKALSENAYKLQSFIANTNKAILTAYLASKSPEPKSRAMALATLKALKITQQTRYQISLMKFMKLKKYCSSTTLALFVKSIPYQTTVGLLKRNINQTARLSKKKWKIRITHKTLEGSYKDIFTLETLLIVKSNVTTPKVIKKWREVL